MRVCGRIAIFVLSAGFWLATAQSAKAFPSSELLGTWSGSFTPQASPAPQLISTKGTSVYSTPVGFFDPQDITFDFTATSQSPFFDLTITDATTPSGTGGFLPAVQFGLSASGATFTAGGEYFVDLSKGGESEVATESFSGTIQVDPANSNLLLLTGTWTDTPVITSLPSNAMCGSAVNFDSVFSLTKEGPSEVPEPSGGALWLGIIIPSLLLLRPWWSRL